MGKFSVRSMILGIGIGLILASLLNMIYLAGQGSVRQLSDQEIINRAYELGMVPASGVIKQEDSNSDSGEASEDGSQEEDSKAVQSQGNLPLD